MKKYALLILMLMITVGIFSPSAQVQAGPSDNYNDCIAYYNPGEWSLYCEPLQRQGGAVAATCAAFNGLGKIICQVNQLLNAVIPVLLALGVVYFVWGVVRYIIAGDDETKKKGREHIIYGLIGLSVIVSLWGLVNVITNTFGLSGAAPSFQSLAVSGTSGTCDLSGKPKLQDLLCYVTRIINDSIIPLIFSLAVLMFVWGVVQYVINSSEEAKKEKGRQFMLWGIIALTVMVSIWGLVGILTATFGIDGSVLPQVKPK
jgi:hypothetical protein